MITSTNRMVKFGCLPSRRHILVAILLVLVLQLVLWVFVAFKPSNNITIYLSRSMDGRSQLAQNQIDFKDAISIGAEQGHHARSQGNRTLGRRQKKKRGGFLAKLDALKHSQLREGDDASKDDQEKNGKHIPSNISRTTSSVSILHLSSLISLINLKAFRKVRKLISVLTINSNITNTPVTKYVIL